MTLGNKAKTLHDLLVNKLMALYDVEIQLVDALPAMAKKSTSPKLGKVFIGHLKETKGHVKRLEQCFDLLALKPKKLKSEAIRGLIDDAKWVMKNVEEGPALDANLIAAAQYVEHYEIAGYGSAIDWATVLGMKKVEQLLAATLGEEKSGSEKLMNLARQDIDARVEGGDMKKQ